jgi:H+/Cl- antiporter ClcA
VISEVVIGMSASIGREAAPKPLGGASGSVLANLAGLSPQQRRLLVACGGGADLVAVFNVPLASALLAAEILLGSISLPVMLPAIVCSWIATATAWVYLPNRPTYLGIPDYRFTASLMTWALLAGPVIGLLSAGYIRLIGWVSHTGPGAPRCCTPWRSRSGCSASSASGTRCSGTAWTWRATRSWASAGSACCWRCSRSSRWSRPCSWAAGRPAACSPRR